MHWPPSWVATLCSWRSDTIYNKEKNGFYQGVIPGSSKHEYTETMILDKLKKLRKPAKEQDFLSQEANCHLLDSTLRSLNCEVEWRDDDDTKVGSYTFQDGSFLLYVPKSVPVVRLCFPLFSSESIDLLDLVQQVCNKINIQTQGTRLVYTLDGEHYEAHVHALANFVLDPNQAKGILTGAMQGMFVSRNQFYTDLESAKMEHGRSGNMAPELDKAQEQRLQAMLYEHDVCFSGAAMPLRDTPTQHITLAEFATEALQERHIIPSRLDIMGDGISQTIDASKDKAKRKQLSDYVLASALVADDTFVRRYVTLRLVFFTADQPYDRRYLTLTLMAGKTTREALYFQVSALLPPLLPDVMLEDKGKCGKMKSCSVLMAYDLKDGKLLQEEFLYLWNDAKDKLFNNQDDLLSDEQRLIVTFTDAHLATSLYLGKRLFLAQRYLEALRQLRNAFASWRGKYEKMSAGERKLFGELCFMLGFCCDALGQYHQGYYFLSLVDMNDDTEYVREMVFNLVSQDDPRAAGYIDSCLNFVRKSVENDTGRDLDEYVAAQHPDYHDLACSLLVARVRLLVQHHQFDKAEEELKKMTTIRGLQPRIAVLRAYMAQEKATEDSLSMRPTSTHPST